MEQHPLTRDEATGIARQRLAILSAEASLEFILLPEYVVEFELGWIFYWDSKRHVETQDFADAVGGNAPLIIDSQEGTIHQTFTSLGTPEELMNWYREKRAGRNK
jgi:hypothetical protein